MNETQINIRSGQAVNLMKDCMSEELKGASLDFLMKHRNDMLQKSLFWYELLTENANIMTKWEARKETETQEKIATPKIKIDLSSINTK